MTRHDLRETPDSPDPQTVEETSPPWYGRKRHQFLAFVSILVISVILYASWEWGDQTFCDGSTAEGDATGSAPCAPRQLVYLAPYLLNLAGVALFVMNTARQKRGRWSLADYWGDHLFRVAQSFAYLYVVLWAWKTAEVGDSGNIAKNFGPNILGFFVGFYILRVERAMQGLGDRFEEMLGAVLPRSISLLQAQQRREQQVRASYRLDEILTQYEAVRSQLGDRGMRELGRHFEQAKREMGEVRVPLETLVGTLARETRVTRQRVTDEERE
jgi:hypothetical protein